jgi:hypothetical protein
MTLKDVAYSGITVIFAIALVMFCYTALNEIVTVTLYDLAASSGMSMALLNNILLLWQWFPVAFLFCCIVWMIYTATISGGQSW